MSGHNRSLEKGSPMLVAFVVAASLIPFDSVHSNARGIKRGNDPTLTFELKSGGKQPHHSREGSKADEFSSTPMKMQKLMLVPAFRSNPFLYHYNGYYDNDPVNAKSSSSGDEGATTITTLSPSTPPIFNRNARRRKVIPHRGPFE